MRQEAFISQCFLSKNVKQIWHCIIIMLKMNYINDCWTWLMGNPQPNKQSQQHCNKKQQNCNKKPTTHICKNVCLHTYSIYFIQYIHTVYTLCVDMYCIYIPLNRHRQIFLKIKQWDKFSNTGYNQQNLHSIHRDDFLVVILQSNYVLSFPACMLL